MLPFFHFLLPFSKFNYKLPLKLPQHPTTPPHFDLLNFSHAKSSRIITRHMANPATILFPTLSLLSLYQSFAISTTYNILDFGANPNGKIDSTNSLSKAWSSACTSIKPSTIYVPQGRFLLKTLHFKGPCRNKAITFFVGGTLIAPSDYNAIGNAGNWLLFESVDGVSIRGGVLDGRGAALWACKNSGASCPSGVTV